MTTPKLLKLGAELTALEERAGITKNVQDAQLGPMFPDLEASPDEYFRETAFLSRMRVRDLIFALDDKPLRKELIAKQCECDEALEEMWQRRAEAAQQRLTLAQGRVKSLPWTWAGCVAVFWVAAGSYFFHLYGAIGGALMGFFTAHGVLAKSRNSKGEAVRAAQEQHDELLQTIKESESTPNWFNATEARTGERDKDFDQVSVYNPTK